MVDYFDKLHSGLNKLDNNRVYVCLKESRFDNCLYVENFEDIETEPKCIYFTTGICVECNDEKQKYCKQKKEIIE